MTAAEAKSINERIDLLAGAITDMKITTSGRLTALETKVAAEAAYCPFREDIARAQNNIKRFEVVEADIEGVKAKVHALELSMARAGIGAGATGGGIVAVIGGTLIFVGKALGWW